MRYKALLIYLILLLLVSCINGCAVKSTILPDTTPAKSLLNSYSHSTNSKRLTKNSYKDLSPQVVIDRTGVATVFWISLESRTPHIKVKFLNQSGWSSVHDLGPCVGDFDIAPAPNQGFLVTNSHWGELYIRNIASDDKGKGQLISAGKVSSPSVTVIGTSKAFLTWQRKISDEVTAIEGAIYNGEDWSEPIQIMKTDNRVIDSFLIGSESGLLLTLVVSKNLGSRILSSKLSNKMKPLTPLIKLRDLPSKDPTVKGAALQDGGFWLVWDEEVGGNGQIYSSRSTDGLIWSDSERISLRGDRNLHPAIAANENILYVVWTSYNHYKGKEEQYGTIRGLWRQASQESWEKVVRLYENENAFFGSQPSIEVYEKRLFITWEYQDEIYASDFLQFEQISSKGAQEP